MKDESKTLLTEERKSVHTYIPLGLKGVQLLHEKNGTSYHQNDIHLLNNMNKAPFVIRLD